MAAKTRSPLQRERDLRETAALYLRGQTQDEIAQRLNVSRQQIGYDLKVLQRRWQQSALAAFNARKAADLAKVDELERTYWEAWHRSCQAREVTTQEKTQENQGDEARFRAGIRKEQRDGNPEFLRGVERCIEMRCKIIGTFAAVKIAPTTPDGKEQWHANDLETNTVLRIAFARLGLPVGMAGDPGTVDHSGQALAAAGADPETSGTGAGSLADAGAADPELPDPAPLFPAGRQDRDGGGAGTAHGAA
jgi:transcriptional regulator with XRE-family HTH domain